VRVPPTLNVSKLLELSETGRARKFIFGLQVNIDKANSRRLPGRWYIGGPSKDPLSAHQCTVYIPRSQFQVLMSSVELS